MARLARVVCANVPQHVSQRGNGRQFLLATDAEREVYLDLLRQAVRLESLPVLGCCLMSNHVHPVVMPRHPAALAGAEADPRKVCSLLERCMCRAGTCGRGGSIPAHPSVSRFCFPVPPPARNLRYNSAMPMMPFMEKFPVLAARETRSVTVRNRDDLPNGEYGFIEFYCDEPHCDCRRVLVVVLRPQTGWKFWAAINYGWESVEFYRRWAGAPASDNSPWQGPVLDPLAEQTSYAPALLELFKFILQSPGYATRLQKHYQLFRAAVEEEAARKAPRRRPPAGSRPPHPAK